MLVVNHPNQIIRISGNAGKGAGWVVGLGNAAAGSAFDAPLAIAAGGRGTACKGCAGAGMVWLVGAGIGGGWSGPALAVGGW